MDDQEQKQPKVRPGILNINPMIAASNQRDENDNPTGGGVRLEITREVNGGAGIHNAIQIYWQDGPRGQEDGSLAPPNGAFVEDVIYAALQRLEFFQGSKFKSEYNQVAIDHLTAALVALDARSTDRHSRGVLGKHEE